MNKTLTLLLLLASLSILSAQNFIDATLLESRTKAQLSAEFGLPVPYGAIFYKIRYSTPDVFGQTDTASGLLVMPDDPANRYPIGMYMHGTSGNRFEVPSRGDYEATHVFAAFGYIGLAPDYLGQGDSRGFHPYMHTASEASSSLDMILASKEYLDQQGWKYNEQLFITGYSQGAHVGASLHRELEKNYSQTLPVTAATHMSGMYSLSGVMRNLILIDSAFSAPSFFAFTFLSFDMIYDLWGNTEEVFKQPYADVLDLYKSSTINGDSLFTLGDLNDSLLVLLSDSAGSMAPMHMFQDSIQLALQSDPNHPLNIALRANDLLDWAPQAPTRLLYCSSDEVIPYQNATVADTAWRAQGAPQLTIFDLSTTLNHVDCAIPTVTNTIFYFATFQEITTGIASLDLPDFRLYPNPAYNGVTLEGLPRDTKLNVLDIYGRSLLSVDARDDQTEISLIGLPQGLLFVRIENGGRIATRKLIHR